LARPPKKKVAEESPGVSAEVPNSGKAPTQHSNSSSRRQNAKGKTPESIPATEPQSLLPTKPSHRKTKSKVPESAKDVATDAAKEAPATEAAEVAPIEAERGPYTSDQNLEFEHLFTTWRATGDPQLRERMILMHRPLVAYVARRFMDRGEQFEDIVQQGVIALIHALDQFDPERGVRFATFATPTIVGELRRYFRDKSWSMRVPRRIQELSPIISLKIEALTQELNRSPTYAEIARSLSLDVEEVAETLELPHRIDPLSLDEPVPTEPGTVSTVADQVGGADPALEEWVEYTSLKTALEKLPEKQRQVLQLAYFQGYSQTEIARTMKVSQMHISRLQRKALSQLRELMEG